MTDVDLKNALLAGDPNAPKDETEQVETHAGVVTVRALNRGEVLRLNTVRDNGNLGIDEYEQRMVSAGLVSPKMTPDEVARWQEVDKAGGVLEQVSAAIARLSGLQEGADKSRVPSAAE